MRSDPDPPSIRKLQAKALRHRKINSPFNLKRGKRALFYYSPFTPQPPPPPTHPRPISGLLKSNVTIERLRSKNNFEIFSKHFCQSHCFDFFAKTRTEVQSGGREKNVSFHSQFIYFCYSSRWDGFQMNVAEATPCFRRYD